MFTNAPVGFVGYGYANHRLRESQQVINALVSLVLMFYWLAKNRVFIGSLLIASYGVIALVLSPKPGIAKLLLSSNPSGSP
ncbi:hypothetical protein T01_6841 [Trichinella spiralis]|uniref:Uncharacterized protein n=1 Tax=Trichinella spiralis TaxID=6334 RepID=A0A0V1AKN9_TRISP|nr:hypothetical protein T01_6841 [Trichinella spiralis]